MLAYPFVSGLLPMAWMPTLSGSSLDDDDVVELRFFVKGVRQTEQEEERATRSRRVSSMRTGPSTGE